MSITFNGIDNKVSLDSKTIYKIDSSGFVINANNPCFCVTMDSALGWVNPGAGNHLPWRTVVVDTHGCFYIGDFNSAGGRYAPGGTSTNSSYTVPVTGYWEISVQYLSDGTTAFASGLLVNGVAQPSVFGGSEDRWAYHNRTAHDMSMATHILYLNAGDVLTYEQQGGETGGPVWSNDINAWSGKLISAV